jgi:hypothetical protein
MAFNWTLITTDTLTEGSDRQYWGYDVGSSGLVLNVRLRIAVPGALPSLNPTKGLEREVYLPGDNVSSFSPSWTLFKDEDLGNRLHRYTHAYATPGGNVLLRQSTILEMYVSNQLRTFYVDEGYTVVENASLSGGDIVSSTGRTGRVSLTGNAGYTPTGSWQDMILTGGGANFEITVPAQAGDILDVKLTLSMYNTIVASGFADFRLLLAGSEIVWARRRFPALTTDLGVNLTTQVVGLSAGSKVLKAQIDPVTALLQVNQHAGTHRGKIEYRLVRN